MENHPTIFLSHRLDALVDLLGEQLERDGAAPLQKRIVLVPNNLVKQWLLLELAKRKGIAMGIQCMAVQEGVFQNHSFPNPLEMFFLLYNALTESSDPDLLSYLGGNEGKVQDLAEQLVPLFFKYGRFGASLFQPVEKLIDWQHAILQKLFVEGSWRVPVQKISRKSISYVHCFGIDFLPPAYWESLFEFSSLSVYLFSPCVEFWEDLCTNRERQNLNRFWKKKGASQANLRSLDAFLRDAPDPLANWGKIGRETLKILGRFEFEMENPPLDDSTLLKKVQADLLYFRKPAKSDEPDESRIFFQEDDSIQISLTGSSKLREVEVLRDAILRLVSQKGVSFDEISVLAPDLEPYVPLIEFVFSEEEASIPYRIFGIDIRSKSSFSQGLSRLADLTSGRWDAEEVLSLFETPAFYRKQQWDDEKLGRFREWIDLAHIDWGTDERHMENSLKETLGISGSSDLRGSWEKGLAALLDRTVFLFPNHFPFKNREVHPDELEEFLELFNRLKASLSAFSGTKTLASWAGCLESIAHEYLLADPEEDGAALQSFRQFLNDLRQAKLENPVFPFSSVRRMLNRPCQSQIHASALHAVRFSSIDEGAMLPARAIFLLGMDETSFPRQNCPSSLDLLKRKEAAIGEGSEPSRFDQDRYLFLQALFSARDFLRISYGHLTADEGKPIGPSWLVQELLSYVDSSFASRTGEKISPCLTTVPPSLSFDARCFSEDRVRSFSKRDFKTAQAFYGPKRSLGFWPDFSRCPEEALPEGEFTIPISHLKLLANHPWRFYLQKIQGIYLSESDPKERSFNLQKSRLLKSSLERPMEEILSDAKEDLPSGLFGEALSGELLEKSEEWRKQLSDWNVKNIFSVCFLENCGAAKWENCDRMERPPIELDWGGRLKVRLTGEIKFATSIGLISTYDDQINGLIKIWPEALAAAMALNAPQILMLKSGKIKVLANPEESLKSFVEYYFRALHSPSPLLPEWADPILRKGVQDLEKKMETTFSGRGLFEDPIIDWIASRTQIPPAEKIMMGWESYLRETFTELIALYPTRAKKGDGHAAV